MRTPARCSTTTGSWAEALSGNDTGADIDDIQGDYMEHPGNHVWVAESDGQVVGMVAVQHHDEGVGEIRRLRVADAYRRRGIGARCSSEPWSSARRRNTTKSRLTRLSTASRPFASSRNSASATIIRAMCGGKICSISISTFTRSRPARINEPMG